MKEPNILTANTYYWRPWGAANLRRRKEAVTLQLVADYLCYNLKFDTVKSCQNTVIGITQFQGDTVTVEFSYSESSAHVYKTLKITKNNNRSNITLLRKIKQFYENE